MVQVQAIRILMLIEDRARQKEVYDRIKLALASQDPTRIPDLFPELFPELKMAMDTKRHQQVLETIDNDLPFEVVSSVDPREAFALLAKFGQLSADDLGVS
jgi:hypothetical protein